MSDLIMRYEQKIAELREKLRVSNAITDDAKAASQRYLDEKRDAQETARLESDCCRRLVAENKKLRESTEGIGAESSPRGYAGQLADALGRPLNEKLWWPSLLGWVASQREIIDHQINKLAEMSRDMLTVRKGLQLERDAYAHEVGCLSDRLAKIGKIVRDDEGK